MSSAERSNETKNEFSSSSSQTGINVGEIYGATSTFHAKTSNSVDFGPLVSRKFACHSIIIWAEYEKYTITASKITIGDIGWI